MPQQPQITTNHRFTIMPYPLSFPEKCLFYVNIVAMTLWFCCLVRFMVLLPLVGRRFLPGGIADFFHTVALIPLLTYFVVRITKWNVLKLRKNAVFSWGLFNALHMAWICYGVIYPHPKIAKHTTYSLILFSWCVLNTIQYAHYAFFVKTKRSPTWLRWSAYNSFYLTFPLGVIGELGQIFLSLTFVEEALFLDWSIRLTAVLFVPVAYAFYKHLREKAAYHGRPGRSSVARQ